MGRLALHRAVAHDRGRGDDDPDEDPGEAADQQNDPLVMQPSNRIALIGTLGSHAGRNDRT